MPRPDAIVLGGGPAGLGAALAMARAGARPVVLEAGERVGGLCVTRRRDGFGYDLGGHIPFVRDDARRRWLADLLDGDLGWVGRPVACVRDGRVVPGRYLDQDTPRPAPAEPPDGTAASYLADRFSPETVATLIRPYLEKVDAMPLERIPAQRVRRLLEGQSAPEGFWFPRRGIGELMDAMAAAVEAEGGRVALSTRARVIDAPGGRLAGVRAEGPGGVADLRAERLVVAVPAAPAAGLVAPGPPEGIVPRDLRMRAVCLVYLALDREALTDEPWIQVADPRVPFARMAEARNWSPALAPPGRTVLGLECYCQAESGDPVWSLDDDALAAACARALADPLGLLDDPGAARALEVVRLPRAYPLVSVDELPRAIAPGRWLDGLAGVRLAAGGAVIEAIEAGERAAAGLWIDHEGAFAAYS